MVPSNLNPDQNENSNSTLDTSGEEVPVVEDPPINQEQVNEASVNGNRQEERLNPALAFPELARALSRPLNPRPRLPETCTAIATSTYYFCEDNWPFPNFSSYDTDTSDDDSSYVSNSTDDDDDEFYAITPDHEGNFQRADSSENRGEVSQDNSASASEEYSETVWTFECVQNTDVSSTTPED